MDPRHLRIEGYFAREPEHTLESLRQTFARAGWTELGCGSPRSHGQQWRHGSRLFSYIHMGYMIFISNPQVKMSSLGNHLVKAPIFIISLLQKL
jgi:hypothetical protein